MAMNKKEKAALEEALTEAALRRTSPVLPDVMPPESSGELSTGFYPVAAMGNYPRVDPACSSSVYHNIGCNDETNSQGAIRMYSTRLLALRALRYEVEAEACKRLRRVDRMIEEELAKD